VAVGQDNKHTNILRVGAAGHIGVSPDSYGKYRFAIYVCTFGDRLSSRNEPDHAAPQALDFSRNHPGRRTGLKFVF
jgi:hypothetical protein